MPPVTSLGVRRPSSRNLPPALFDMWLPKGNDNGSSQNKAPGNFWRDLGRLFSGGWGGGCIRFTPTCGYAFTRSAKFLCYWRPYHAPHAALDTIPYHGLWANEDAFGEDGDKCEGCSGALFLLQRLRFSWVSNMGSSSNRACSVHAVRTQCTVVPYVLQNEQHGVQSFGGMYVGDLAPHPATLLPRHSCSMHVASVL